ncbi:MAG: cation:proton antiporter [Proteobacteria bacterium]|nr:cation:proton antiporter [Pseudomonadota bacterium]
MLHDFSIIAVLAFGSTGAESHLDQFPLIKDLGLILIAAGIASILCRYIRLPILVGYLVAGLLIGPHIGFFPTVLDVDSIHTWAEIGVIFLLFALGLEFNFKSLLRVGRTGVITSACVVTATITATYFVGRLLDWSFAQSVFIGGLLSVSSTMIVVKVFEELDLKGKPFTHIVYGVEIVEDMVGIVMMVVLPMVALSQSEMLAEESLTRRISTSTMLVAFFTVIWFVGGIFIIPTLLRKLKPKLNDEVQLILGLALCLGMVLLADYSGMSVALGAFAIGSILGATTEAHHFETILTPVKNLFGAIFFVAVGMMADWRVVVEHWDIVLLALLIVNILKPIAGTIGVLLSGKSVQQSFHAGFAFGHIGEFSFIIVLVGLSKGVIDAYIFPIVITVSMITTVTTPYVLKSADFFIDHVGRYLPKRLQHRIESDYQSVETKKISRRAVLLKYFMLQTLIVSIILLAVIYLVGGFLEAHCAALIGKYWQGENLGLICKSVFLGLMLLAMLPFLSALVLRRQRMQRSLFMLLIKGGSRGFVFALQGVRIAITIGFVIFSLYVMSPFDWYINLPIAAVVVFTACRFEVLFSSYVRLERQFLFNYNEVELHEQRSSEKTDVNMTKINEGGWLPEGLSVAEYRIDESSPFIDKSLIELNLRAKLGLFVVLIEHEHDVTNIPAGNTLLVLDDIVYIVGKADALKVLTREPYNISEKLLHIQPMRRFARELKERRTEAGRLRCIVIPIHADSGLANVSLRESGISERNKCLVIGIEVAGRVEMNPSPDTTFEPGTRIWVVGEKQALTALLAENL